MNGEPLRRSVVVTNPEGLHVRPAATFAALAQKFQSDVALIRNGERLNGKSGISLIGLAGQGTELVLEIAGPDQEQAMQALGDLLARLAKDGIAAAPGQ